MNIKSVFQWEGATVLKSRGLWKRRHEKQFVTESVDHFRWLESCFNGFIPSPSLPYIKCSNDATAINYLIVWKGSIKRVFRLKVLTSLFSAKNASNLCLFPIRLVMDSFIMVWFSFISTDVKGRQQTMFNMGGGGKTKFTNEKAYFFLISEK